jgi:VanZ family protein
MSRRALPAVLFAAAILAMAGPWASAEATGAVTSSFFSSFGIPEEVARVIHTVLRKCGHAVAYAVFGVLVWWAVPGGGRPVRRPLVSLGFAVALATADELLQGLSPARGSSFYDVLLDAGGAMLGIALAARVGRARARRGAGAPMA